MPKTRANGFSMAEILITLMLIGVISMLLLPMLIHPSEDRESIALIRESFALIGESYLKRKNDADLPDENIGMNESTTFANYLYEHLNAMSAVDPSGVADLCTDQSLFVLQKTVTIRAICDVAGTPDSLQVKVRVPVNGGRASQDFWVVIPEGEERYTTKYGFTGTGSDCNLADTSLHIVNRCP